MAIVHFVKSKRTQTVGGLNAVINYCCKDAKVDYQGRPLISGILVTKKTTVYRTPDGELSVHIYPKIPK